MVWKYTTEANVTKRVNFESEYMSKIKLISIQLHYLKKFSSYRKSNLKIDKIWDDCFH